MRPRTVIINGFSKSHSMTGYRIGYAAAPLPIAKAMTKLQSQITSCASSISQYAAHQALVAVPHSNPTWLKDRVQELRTKRDIAYELIMTIPNVTCPLPTGAFYLLPDISAYFGMRASRSGAAYASPSEVPRGDSVLISNSVDLCKELLRAEGVALVPGSAFGADSTVRISYATDTDVIVQAINRLRTFLASLQE